MASQKASMELAKVGGFSPHLALIVLGDDIPGVFAACGGLRTRARCPISTRTRLPRCPHLSTSGARVEASVDRSIRVRRGAPRQESAHENPAPRFPGIIWSF